MFDALRALGRSVELLMFDDDGHEIVKRENRAVLVRAMATGSPRRSRPRPFVTNRSWRQGLTKLSAG